MAIGFRGRLISAMVALVVLVSLATSAMLMVYLFEDEQTRAREQLQLAEQVSLELLARQTEVHTSRLEVVARDFGLRSAIASGDRATADGALGNHLNRVGARFGAIVDNNRQVLATAGLDDDAKAPGQLVTRGGQSATLVMRNGQGFEVLAIPIQAAGLRVSLLAGFALDQSFASMIARLSGTEVVLRGSRGTATGYKVFARSQPLSGPLGEAMEQVPVSGELLAEGDRHPYFSRLVELDSLPGDQLQIILLLDRAASLQNYYNRAVEMSWLAIGVLLTAALLALFVARNLGQPVLQLAGYARAIGQGRAGPVPRIRTGGELQELATAMTSMQANLRQREAQISYNASHDDVTGLFNRSALLQRLEERFGNNDPCSLVGIRLVDLSDINDTLGLDFGDKVLSEVSERLQQALPDTAMLARTSGNEFLILTDKLASATLSNAALAFKQATEQPLQIDDVPFTLRCNVVTLQLPDDAADNNEMRRRLNLTFEQARHSNLPVVHYQPGDDETHLRELQIIRDLPQALERGTLYMNYQPKLDMETGTMIQVEALVRWVHPELGFIPPDEFIALAESSGQVSALTRHIMQQIARDAADWEATGMDIGIAVNLSALDLAREELPGEVSAAFASWRGRMERITLEVTESAVMEEPERALATLHQLRGLGVTLAVDDFGTGYSSLSQLRKMPVQELKIDKSFVLNLASEPQDRLIVRSTLDMAHGLNLKVVAEGIEDNESWSLLRQWGCDLGQGFYMSRPVAPDKLADVARDIAGRQTELAP